MDLSVFSVKLCVTISILKTYTESHRDAQRDTEKNAELVDGIHNAIDVHVADPFSKTTAPAFMRTVLQNIGPLIAGPVTFPDDAYPQLGDTVGVMKWGVIGLIVLAGAAFLFYKERKR